MVKEFIKSITSRQAYTKATKSGVKDGQQAVLLKTIKKYSKGLINGELAARSGLGRDQVFRRMPELEQLGYVERRYDEDGQLVKRPYNGYNQQVWFPTEGKNG